MTTTADRAIAIVGVGAILPDAPTADVFWQNIVNKRYSITETPPDRWSIPDYFDTDPKAPDKTYSKIGGWVKNFEFDWKRFRIPPKVVDAMDEGQRWAVTICADVLADYGYPERPLNTDQTAVILGTAMGGELHYITNQRIVFPEYAHALEAVPEFKTLPDTIQEAILSRWHGNIDATFPPITEDSMPGELPNIVSGRVANVFNLRGPNFITDAACASSFAAVEAACELLIEHKVDAVLTGGVDRNMGISSFVKFCKIGALSATGTRPFGDGADGFVMGEGAGAFLLKRLEDAERAGDKIYAVIRGIGGASDGKGKGITAPNPIGQQLAMQRAWESAGLDPATATMVEAHGTSTRVGDAVEIESLSKLFGGASKQSIGLGSAKSNIGHLKAGAGAAGMLKATMALYNKTLPPTLNSEVPNPNIDFTNSPFFLIHEPTEWKKANGTPRRCGVSAYGFGGTNFHLFLEEYVPGMLAAEKKAAAKAAEPTFTPSLAHLSNQKSHTPSPVRGIFAIGAKTPTELQNKLDQAVDRVKDGWTPAVELPKTAVLQSVERLIIDFGDHDELLDRLQKARKVMGFDNDKAWKAMQAQGVFRGSGKQDAKIAFLFPGQGSQYVNMGRELLEKYPVVAEVFKEADEVMTPILGKPLTDYIFVDSDDQAALMQAQLDLMQTEITQPAMLTMDIAMYKLLAQFGFKPDMVMGHSLGEYAALIAAGIMPFAHALEAAAARGSEMTKVSMDDNGWMAAVLAPYEVIEATLKEIDGYVVSANINSSSQCVIGGASKAVEQAIKLFQDRGYRAIQIPVSHAFHTKIVAPASGPLRKVLDRMEITAPKLPLVANVTGDLYPITTESIKDILEQQIASPVQWVKGLETLYANGVRTFLEVGPKRALRGFVNDVFANNKDVLGLMTNHPKTGELPTFNQALCGLYAAGFGFQTEAHETKTHSSALSTQHFVIEKEEIMTHQQNGSAALNTDALSQLLVQAIQQSSLQNQPGAERPFDRNRPPLGSVIISGTGLGLPGSEKSIMDPNNALRILNGEQFVDLIPERFREKMVNKHITRLVKAADGSGSFKTIDDPDLVIKLAGRPGYFDLAEEYGVPEKLITALDMTTQLAMAAGLDALREAGIPLTMAYKRTTTGKYLPQKWMLPEALRDETAVIFASAFPGGDRFAEEFRNYYTYQSRVEQLEALEDLRRYTKDHDTMLELNRRILALREQLQQKPYIFDRKFLFRILAMGHSQFAEYIGARGPNTQVNAACASTTQAIGIAEDWIRNGRCRRVIVIAADNVTGDNLMEWVGSGFLSLGAAATDDRVQEAALPFDKRRHGTILGMGACALVVESEDAVRERGMRGIVELLSSETRNSAFHGSRLDMDHIAMVMDCAITTAERRFGLNRQTVAPQLVFMSHETYTPARGGSASAEVIALRKTFGEAAKEIVVANTKGFTGHPMGVGIEDVIALKILEHGIVPPVPNYKEVDPELGQLNLSRGGRYPVQYSLHLSAGFGSQIAFSFTRRIPGSPNRTENQALYQQWLDTISGYDHAETEVEKRVLRIVANGAPARTPAPNRWQWGTGPTMRTAVSEGAPIAASPAAMIVPQIMPAAEPVQVAPPNPEPTPETVVPIVEKTAVLGQPEAQNPEPLAVSPEPIVAAPAPMPEPAAPAVDEVAAKVLHIVAEQTGYPTDMLDMDLDLEADLGIDTVKQAETFAAIRSEFNIPRRDDMNLREYSTLEKVISFVKEMRPDLAVSCEPVAVSPKPAEITPLMSHTITPSPTADSISTKVLAIVAEATGYPTDMLDMDLDLEADLGIDTVKQAETFAAIRSEFDIPRRDDLNLRDYNTLERVVGFVKEMRPDLAVSREPLAVSPEPAAVTPALKQLQVAHPATPSAPTMDDVAEKVLAIVADQTGYPIDMLELDLDLEADLGVDTVKQAETFAAIRQMFGIPRRDDLNLRDYNTLERVIGFVKEMRPDLAVSREPMIEDREPMTVTPVPTRLTDHGSHTPSSLEDADKMPRRVAMAAIRPSLTLCKPTGVFLNENSRVVVAMDNGGVGKALVKRLKNLSVTVLTLDVTLDAEEIAAQTAAWLADGAIQGVYWLPALDVAPNLESMSFEAWREANRIRVKSLSITMRNLYHAIAKTGDFLVSAVRLGGRHGYDDNGAVDPLGGGVVGFTKAYKRERGDVLVKAVDFEVSRKTAVPADALIAETLTDPGVVEVGYYSDNRYAVTLVESPAKDGKPGMTLNKETVFVVTGAAGGITSAIVNDLAAASSGIFYLLDLVEAPAPDDAKVAMFRTDKEALKQHLIEEARAAGERPTPVLIETQIMEIERSEAALRAIEAVEAADGTAVYRSANLLDNSAVSTIVDEIRATYGRIDVLVHAGGIEISKGLNEKPIEQFDLVYDIKADGMFSLLNAAKDMPIGATVSFSSVAGRFGNSGQTDYSAANDLLCKITTSFRSWRPETKGIAIDWTAWGGIGMATRGSIPKIMEMAGIEMLPPESGIPTVRRELVAGSFNGEIVVGGKLGILVEEWDETGGLDIDKVNAELAAQNLLMIGEVKAAKLYGGLEVETTLDPNAQAFLYDHAMDNTPLLPGVMGTETFAELAAVLAPGFNVAAVEDEQFHSPFKFYRMEPQTLVLNATAVPAQGGSLIVHTTLRSVRELGKPGLSLHEKLHFTAKVRLVLTDLPQPNIDFTPPADNDLPIVADDIYKIYFHGPAYKVLERAKVDGNKAIGKMPVDLPPNSSPADATSLIAPRLVELCFQTAGVWEIKTKGVMALPMAIHSVTAYRQEAEVNGKPLYAMVTAVDDGQQFNAQVIDADGNVYVMLAGYRTVQLPGAVTL